MRLGSSLRADGPDRIVHEGTPGVVGIFSLSSHPVITVIMVWTGWMPVLIRAAAGG
jgi:hypothetical protein